MEQWTAEEYNRYIKLGIKPGEGKREDNKAVKAKKMLEQTDLFKADTSTPKTLFPLDDNIVLKDNKEFVEIELWLSGNPLPKQSYKSGITRYRSAGYHTCPYTGKQVQHKQGDALTYKNKINGLVDVIPIAYTDAKYTKRTEEYKLMIKDQLPKDFIMFTEEVHIVKLEFIFQPLASFSKKLLQQIEDGSIVKYKCSKPDWENTAKLLMDSMSKLVYQDDSLICTVNGLVMKYGITPGIVVKLSGK